MPTPTGIKLIAENRRARFDYEFLERLEAGLVLSGTEVKAAREGKGHLAGAYAEVRDGEAWLVGASIDEYGAGGAFSHVPERDRKLLMHRSEIDSLHGKVREKGLTLVPTRMYFKDGRVKVEIGVARGKKNYDKRQALRERQDRREADRAMSLRANR